MDYRTKRELSQTGIRDPGIEILGELPARGGAASRQIGNGAASIRNGQDAAHDVSHACQLGAIRPGANPALRSSGVDAEFRQPLD
ncbi:MAG: hypothetical protein J0J15_32635, partial [Mesorhizobium sp.]|nr:hypothetical protein [Mesorhizobium sp.]